MRAVKKELPRADRSAPERVELTAVQSAGGWVGRTAARKAEMKDVRSAVPRVALKAETKAELMESLWGLSTAVTTA